MREPHVTEAPLQTTARARSAPRGRLLTPARFLFTVAIVGSAVVVLYGLLVERSGLQIPITVSGLAVLGISLVLLSLWSAGWAVRAGRRGEAGKAFLGALFGGVCTLAAAGALAGAVVLGILASSV